MVQEESAHKLIVFGLNIYDVPFFVRCPLFRLPICQQYQVCERTELDADHYLFADASIR